MTTTLTKGKTLQHTLRIDLTGLQLTVEAPDSVDAEKLAEQIGSSLQFDHSELMLSLAQAGYDTHQLSIDWTTAFDCAEVDASVEETEEIED